MIYFRFLLSGTIFYLFSLICIHLILYFLPFCFSRVEFTDSSGRLTVHQAGALPAWLQERYQLLRYFATYMEENLTEAGDSRAAKAAAARLCVIPHVRRWDRTPKSIIMQLSNGTFQVLYFSLCFMNYILNSKSYNWYFSGVLTDSYPTTHHGLALHSLHLDNDAVSLGILYSSP